MRAHREGADFSEPIGRGLTCRLYRTVFGTAGVDGNNVLRNYT
jgi:hypothetical protein